MHSWHAVRCANPSCSLGVLPRHVVPACILGVLSGVQTRRAVPAYCPGMWFRHAFLACCPVCKPVVQSRRIAPTCGSGMHSWRAVRCANPSCGPGVLPRHVVPACILGVLSGVQTLRAVSAYRPVVRPRKRPERTAGLEKEVLRQTVSLPVLVGMVVLESPGWRCE